MEPQPQQKTSENELAYHTQYSRPLRGCFGVFVLLAVVVVLAVFCLVRIRFEEPLPPAREGMLHYRCDELQHLQVLMRTPMPLPLPRYVDPARCEEAAAQALPPGFRPGLSKAPAERIYSAAHDSAVLDAAHLIELPPPGLRDAAPDADGEEVQP